MINSGDKISNFPPEFNELEERVKILESKITELEKLIKERTE